MMNNNKAKCLLCGSKVELKHNEYPGYQQPEVFQIYHCSYCNTAFSTPRVETDSLYEKIYKNGILVPDYSRYWHYAEIVKEIKNPLKYLAKAEAVYWSIKEALSLYVNDKKSIKILEIGSGLGYLTYSLRKADYDTIGLDISQTAVKQASETFGNHYICANIFEFAQLHAESFDIVILTEVIEHIEKPLYFMESIMKLLKPSGRAIITTPNKSFYPLDVIWASSLPPVHYWWFSEDSMRYFADKTNTHINFINFRDFYKKIYFSVDVKSLLSTNLPNSTFNKNGELIINSNETNKILKSRIRSFAKEIPFARKIYGKLKDILNTNIIVCKDSGVTLCAIFTKI